jgi:hypothetical protein
MSSITLVRPELTIQIVALRSWQKEVTRRVPYYQSASPVQTA